MKIERIGEAKVIMSLDGSLHNYFGWPSLVRLKNGRIAAGASGMRLAHVCPFGKAVIAFSEDEGETYTAPAIAIDSTLDDRDVGLCAFGKSGLIVTSFNNSVNFQRGSALRVFKEDMTEARKAYVDAYLDNVTREDEQRDIGGEFRVSFDNGVTFGPVYKSDVTSPHGPVELSDGTILWVGRTFNSDALERKLPDEIRAYRVDPVTGAEEYVGRIENVSDEDGALLSCEPHAAELPDGTLICHIRVQRNEIKRVFTTYQSVSRDKGATWTKPEPVLEPTGGAPAHLLLHSSGVLISTYGYREPVFGVRAMFSTDGGRTWDTNNIVYENPFTGDLGYPETVELADGSLITAFYAHPEKTGPAKILQQKWRFER